MKAGTEIGVAIIGCGMVGHKRAKSLGPLRLVACADADFARAQALARTIPTARAVGHWQDILERSDVDIIIVATPHNVLAAITLAAIRARRHVLVEKPAGRRAGELEPVIEAAERVGTLVRVGFNHRYHPSIQKARQLVDAGSLGNLMFVRGRYGHGGRLGYEQEWRAKPEVSGGGELIDQGVHLIDLARWFLGDFPHVQGFSHTYFWKMPVEDNGFLLLRTERNQAAFLHASWTEWKNLFSFEIYGQHGKVDINGLGGSYGTERLAHYRMLPHMGPPETSIWEYPMPDSSWELEMAEFAEDVRLGRQPSAGLRDAHAALRIVEQVYEASAS